MIFSFISLICIFIVNPCFCVFFSILYLGIINPIRKYDYFFFFIFLSLFLGLINTTKIPENDLLNYQKFFNQAELYSLDGYLKVFGKEPVFYTFTYLFYYVSAGDFKIYVLFFSFVSYFFLFQSIFLFYKKINQLHNIIFAILLIAFFDIQFFLSAHLVRQFLAGNLMMYYLINKIFYKKNNWLLLILIVFVHSSALFFVPLIFLPFLKNKIKSKALIFLSIFLIVLLAFFSILNSYLLRITKSIMFLNYIFTRAGGKLTDTDSGQMNSLTLILIFFLILTTIYLIYFKKSKFSPHAANFYNIFLGLSMLILCTISQPLLSIRFFFYVYFFIPFIVPLIIPRFNLLRSLIIIALLIRLGIRLETGVFKYDDVLTLATNNFFSYFQS